MFSKPAYRFKTAWLFVMGMISLLAATADSATAGDSAWLDETRTLLQDETHVDCDCKTFGEQRVVNGSEVPEYMRQKGITSQYRPVSCLDCALISIGGLHNETVNIWTHLIGLVLALALALSFGLVTGKTLQKELGARHLTATQAFKHIAVNKNVLPTSRMQLWPLVTFHILTAIALLISVLSHTFACTPEEHSALWWTVDQAGITLGAMGVNIVVIIYLFNNSPLKTLHRHLYVASSVVAVAGTLSIMATWIPDAHIRVPLLGIGALLRMVYLIYPIIQIWKEKKAEPVYKETIRSFCGAGIILATGVLLQITMLPESLSERTFDLYGSSHQIYHVCIVIGMVVFHAASARLWEYLVRQEASKALQALANSGAEMHLCTSPSFMSCGDASIDLHSQERPQSGTYHSADLMMDTSKMSPELAGRKA